MPKNGKAFSLIELSVVIIVIGILITGVIQGTRMVYKFRLSAAQSLTKSSPVHTISGLVLWLEPTSINSFLDSETEDGTAITQWKDINPQTARGYYAIPTSSPSAVLYKASSPINSLPSIYFSGAGTNNNYLSISSTASIANSTPIATPDNAFTFFLVSKMDVLDSTFRKIFFSNGVYGINGWAYIVRDIIARDLTFYGVTEIRINVAVSDPDIVSAKYSGDSSQSYNFYAKGSAIDSGTTTIKTPSTKFVIGGDRADSNYQLKGYISELIVYNRALKEEERKAVEKYLAQKYAIKITI